MQAMMMNQSKIQEGMDQYTQPKPDGDIDLVDAVRQLLLGAGLHANVQSSYNDNRFIREAMGKPSTIQRFLLNRYWNQQLLTASHPSIEERYCLIPNGDVKDWMKLFQAKILPFLMANGLPVVI